MAVPTISLYPEVPDAGEISTSFKSLSSLLFSVWQAFAFRQSPARPKSSILMISLYRIIPPATGYTLI